MEIKTTQLLKVRCTEKGRDPDGNNVRVYFSDDTNDTKLALKGPKELWNQYWTGCYYELDIKGHYIA